MRGHKRVLVVLVAAAAVAGASACSSSEGGAEDGRAQVATLESAGSTPAASAKPADARPRERLDTTEAELEVMLEPYYKCIREQGATPKKDMGDKFGDRAPAAELEKLIKADKVCNPKFYPLPPWEKDPANPESRDFARDVVKCLKGKGVKYVEADESGYALGGPNNDSQSISKGMELAPECEREVAAKRK
ncbi:hypothetical protein [Couchioplanes caeruleus]|uniref:hypothetical protein n=1 Tax=Couchioplanes caeruleus TaxID=56438 RepID=UPI0009FDC09B|nr:hypothetical protein [Couchioplanes caeruleus]